MLTRIAFRNIFRQRRRSLLTAGTMITAFILLSLSLAVSDGSYNNIIRLFTEDHTGHVQLHRTSFLDQPQMSKTLPVKIPYVRELQQYIKEERHIIATTSRVKGPALLYAKDKSLPVQVIGINPPLEAKTSKLARKISSGIYLEACGTENKKPVMIGAAIAERASLALG